MLAMLILETFVSFHSAEQRWGIISIAAWIGQTLLVWRAYRSLWLENRHMNVPTNIVDAATGFAGKSTFLWESLQVHLSQIV